MGAVYEAYDMRLRATVALKQTFFTDGRLEKQFELEAHLLATIHHPALPRVSDYFTEANGLFLVMQFISGDTLAQMIRVSRKPFPPLKVLEWADQLLDALDYLHTLKPPIIHRDIKPENLKLTDRGQVILLDFGLAEVSNDLFPPHDTSERVIGYTPAYAPLEQIQDTGTGPRSDLFSLGATLYHLMTGVRPADALTRFAAISEGRLDPLRHANELEPHISPAVSSVLQWVMALNPEKRPSTAYEMRAALRTAQNACAPPWCCRCTASPPRSRSSCA